MQASSWIGLVWLLSHDNDHNRSIALSELLLPILDNSIEWHSLQKEYRDGDYELVEATPQLHDHHKELHDFSDTLRWSIVYLVITVDTSVAHLVGALGKRVWIMLPHVPDYRWLLIERICPGTTPRGCIVKKSPGDWESVLESIR